MTPEEAMGILKKQVKLIQRGSLKKMAITSIDQSIAYKYILHRFVIMMFYFGDRVIVFVFNHRHQHLMNYKYNVKLL